MCSVTPKNKESFKQCVYDIFCQCYNQCVNLTPQFTKSQPVCSEIVYTKGDSQNYLAILKNSMKFFITTLGLLSFSDSNKLFITEGNAKLRLTWNNIKKLESPETKELFWLFRKVVVDSILKIAVSKLMKVQPDPSLKIYSVGSTSMSSDYDITLYGTTKSKVYIIKTFKSIFLDYFNEDSSIVFDTNLYGEAYITFDSAVNFKKTVCGNQTFYYLEKSSNPHFQIIWATTRYLKDLRESFGESISNQITNWMSRKLGDSKIFEQAKSLYMYLSNKDTDTINYDLLLQSKDRFLKVYSKSEALDGLYDYISLVNYFGVETYITRGAFLDVVVNTQMCKEDLVQLETSDYICSILENVSFYFGHNSKTKYVLRAKNTLEKIKSLPGIQPLLDNLTTILDSFKTTNADGKIDYDSNYCTSIVQKDTYIDLSMCPKENLFSILINIVYVLLKNSGVTGTDLPFYTKFVYKNNGNLFVKDKSKSLENLLS